MDDDDAKVIVGRRAKDGDAHDPAAVMEAVMAAYVEAYLCRCINYIVYKYIILYISIS